MTKLNKLLITILGSASMLLAYVTFKTHNVTAASIDVSTNNASYSQEQINGMVRDYILDHPEIIITALEKLQQKKIDAVTKQNTQYLDSNRDNIFDTSTAYVYGNKDAKDSIVIFYDYRCGYCHKATAVLDTFAAKNKNVKVLLRPIGILGDDSDYIAKIVISVLKLDPSKFYVIHNAILEMKKPDRAKVLQILVDNGLNPDEIEKLSSDPQISSIIYGNLEMASKLGVKAVPAYLMKGNVVTGFYDMNELEKFYIE